MIPYIFYFKGGFSRSPNWFGHSWPFLVAKLCVAAHHVERPHCTTASQMCKHCNCRGITLKMTLMSCSTHRAHSSFRATHLCWHHIWVCLCSRQAAAQDFLAVHTVPGWSPPVHPSAGEGGGSPGPTQSDWLCIWKSDFSISNKSNTNCQLLKFCNYEKLWKLELTICCFILFKLLIIVQMLNILR